MNRHVNRGEERQASRSGEDEGHGCSLNGLQAAADSQASSSSVWDGVNGDHQSTDADESRETARELRLMNDDEAEGV